MKTCSYTFCRIFFLILFSHLSSHAYNLRQISSREGLSNSSVFCLYQDNDRLLWIGTYDGLNVYNGKDIHIYKPNINDETSLSGNVIRSICQTGDDYLWIHTKSGMNKFAKQNNRIEEYYTDFREDAQMVRDRKGNLYVFDDTGTIFFYDKKEKGFIKLFPDSSQVRGNTRSFIIDSQDTMYIKNRGVVNRYTVDHTSTHPVLKQHTPLPHTAPIDYTFCDKEKVLFIDRAYNLYIKDTNKTHLIKNLASTLRKYGAISSIVFDNEDIIIAFTRNGVVRLQEKTEYEPEKIEINCGVYSLWKDDVQDILWIGTDGQGVYAYTKDQYLFKSMHLKELPIKNERPVRAIYTDHLNNLWIGTKGNGIIKIKDYDTPGQEYTQDKTQHFTTADGLNHNAVFTFLPDTTHQVLWIGSDGPGVNYYCYRDQKIHSLKNYTGRSFIEVHSLLKASENEMWVASVNSLINVQLEKKNGTFEAHDIHIYDFDLKHKQPHNKIYSLYAENDSIMWVGVRGNGIIRLNTETHNYSILTFTEKGIGPMNDILCMCPDKMGNLWFGSSYGITKISGMLEGETLYRNYNENDGLPNNTIHGILESPNGKLWLSSNRGIILFDPEKETFRSFTQNTGLKTIEFSDNAYFRDEISKTCFFGGVDGIVWIKYAEKEKKEFIPDIIFTGLRVFNEELNISHFIREKKKKTLLELTHKQNFFTLSFIANDFINGENGKFSYQLENFSNVWMTARAHEAQFTNIPPGEYLLKIRYDDGTGNNLNNLQILPIVILPPWYQTVYAKIVYLFLLIGFVYMVYLYIQNRYEKRKRKIARQLDQKYKEEIYEGKLRFFTNITHEFCTPLTLIHGPNERILHYEGSDAHILKYARIIKSNTERLNNLIQEIIDFRRIETGNHICRAENHEINRLLTGTIESFTELAEENNLLFKTDIQPDITWKTDESCFTKITNNLISNAFKYTAPHGTIRVSLFIENNKLILKVYNTGKGIKKENIPLIFNRYSVLDTIEENSIKGISSRNGLGLAICLSLVETLQGEIQVHSEVNEYAEFTVTFPDLSIPEIESEIVTHTQITNTPMLQNDPEKIVRIHTPETGSSPTQTNKNRILIIDDNEELLWMLEDMLSEEYKITTATNGNSALQSLTESAPDLIITDIMMPGIDGISLTRQIKENRHTMHIPLLILSARTTTDEKIEGIESGADAYLSKPFEPSYLKTTIRQLIRNKNILKEYYTTSASAYEYIKGQLLKKEERDFLQHVTEVIDQNINNIEFTPEQLADELKISSRKLYRKFKELNQPSPKDFIKEQRIGYAARLLVTTTLTIQEIMYESGFTSRSHFYKEFHKRYQLTAKEYRGQNQQKDNLVV